MQRNFMEGKGESLRQTTQSTALLLLLLFLPEKNSREVGVGGGCILERQSGWYRNTLLNIWIINTLHNSTLFLAKHTHNTTPLSVSGMCGTVWVGILGSSLVRILYTPTHEAFVVFSCVKFKFRPPWNEFGVIRIVGREQETLWDALKLG